MGFSQSLRLGTEQIWQHVFTHPFVAGIGDGSLPLAKFRFYMCQDYAFLIEYSRVLALAVVKSPDLALMGRFAGLLDATLNTEMALHRAFAERFGIPAEELGATEPAPTTRAYTRHLLGVAHSGSLAEIGAALLPCHVGYLEIGQRLAARGLPEGQRLYREWIGLYTSREYESLANWLRELVDRLAEDTSKMELRRAEETYRTSARYEYLFWEMAYREERWPV